MPHSKNEKKAKSKLILSRRGFVKMAGATGMAAGLTKWTPRALAQAPASSNSLAPLFPGAGVNQAGLPFGSATSMQVFLAYDPATDPDAKYYRSRVPVAQRIPAFAATQAQPNLSALPQVTNLSVYSQPTTPGDNTSYQSLRYGNTNAVFTTRFQQYQDILGGWQGAQGIPTIGYIDAAHRNGCITIGIVFQPYIQDGDPNSFLAQAADGSFPAGDKLIELAQYFGFDGYFFNVELSLTTQQVTKLMSLLNRMQQSAKKHGLPVFHLQWYDAATVQGFLSYENQLDDLNAGWVTKGGANSIFINYAWGQDQVQESVQEAAKLKINPLNQVYFGILAEGRDQIGISESPSEGGGDNLNQIPLLIPPDGTGPAQVGIALFDPSAATVNMATANATAANNGVTPSTNPLLTAIYEAERQFWIGASENPATPYKPTTANPYGGVSNYITERSTIGSLPFVSRFNTGTGSQFFINGAVSSQSPWFSMGIQDILPTWQWWTKDFYNNTVPSGLLSADYDLTTVWNGGSSLKVSGSLGPKNPTELRLFKTKLAIPDDNSPLRTITITYKVAQPGPSNLYLGLIFEDNPTQTEWKETDNCEPCAIRNQSGWSQAVVNLFPYQGRTIAAISLGFKVGPNVTTASNYAINIGEIAVLNEVAYALYNITSSNLTIEASEVSEDGASAQLRLTWDFDPTVWYYDIYRRNKPNNINPANWMWLGRITGDCYYVSNLQRIGAEKSAVIQLQAVAIDGSNKSSRNSSITFSWLTSPEAGDLLSISTSSVNFASGTSTTVPITLLQSNSADKPVTLSISGLPNGVTAAFSPNPATGATAVLTLTASSSVAAGTFAVEITGTSGRLTQTVNLSVSVGTPDFTLSDSAQGFVPLGPGLSTDTITINPVYGFTGKVALSVTGLPPGVTASFSPQVATGTSTLTFHNTNPVPFVPVTLIGTSGSLTKTLNLYIYGEEQD